MSESDLIQAIAKELAEVLDDQPLDTLDEGRQVRLHRAASRVVGYLVRNYELGPLPED